MPYKPTSLAVLLRAFPGIPDAEAIELVNNAEVRSYPPETILCHEDSFETTFYIIMEGEVRVSKIIDYNQVRMLKKLSAGDFFGEMGLIHNAPRAATVTTTLPTTVLEIRKETFDRLLGASASLSLAMVREVSRRLRENDAMAIEDLRLKAGELAAAYQRLAEQDYARREFLGTIAHELRTPLTTASGFLQVIQKGQLQGEAFQLALESVTRNVQQIVTLVNDLLFLQEMDMILARFQPVNLETLLTGLVEQYRSKNAGIPVQLKANISAGLPLVNGDVRSLERAFGAILDNAIKFSPEGGDVWIEVRQVGSQVWTEVQDQGVGIPAYALPFIFDRFFHMEQLGGHMFGGVGLGLSIARQVVEQHGGEISVTSEVGVGSCVRTILNAVA